VESREGEFSIARARAITTALQSRTEASLVAADQPGEVAEAVLVDLVAWRLRLEAEIKGGERRSGDAARSGEPQLADQLRNRVDLLEAELGTVRELSNRLRSSLAPRRPTG